MPSKSSGLWIRISPGRIGIIVSVSVVMGPRSDCLLFCPYKQVQVDFTPP